MSDVFETYGIQRYLNAHDTITLLGGSRLAENTKQAMWEISTSFVDIIALQRTLGQRVAEVTNNEAAYLANSAAGAMQLATAVAMVKGSEYHYRHLPHVEGIPKEVIVIHSHHNCYDKAIESAGATIKFVGDADTLLPWDLEQSITEQTAAVFFFLPQQYQRGGLPLATVVEIAHRQGVPVIVDAAAQLPPVENLWQLTQTGADMVIFSGGKTLCGPQDSGLILGKQEYIADCIRFGAPMHGIHRQCKTSRESMVGLCVAIENYMALDHKTHAKKLAARAEVLRAGLAHAGLSQTWIVPRGAVGQTYPRAFAQLPEGISLSLIVDGMRERGVFIGSDPQEHQIYLNPLNLTDQEAEYVTKQLQLVMKELLK